MPVKAHKGPIERAFLFFTPKEVARLKKLYADLYSIDEIAQKLGRTSGSVQQKIFRLGLPPRNHDLIRMIGIHGRGLLRYGHTVEEIKKAKAEERRVKRILKRKLQGEAVAKLKQDLSHGMDRNTAIINAYANGANQTQIGNVTGMTKQNVSLILKGK